MGNNWTTKLTIITQLTQMEPSNESMNRTMALIAVGSVGVLGLWVLSKLSWGLQCFVLGATVAGICACGAVGYGLYYWSEKWYFNGK